MIGEYLLVFAMGNLAGRKIIKLVCQNIWPLDIELFGLYPKYGNKNPLYSIATINLFHIKYFKA